MEAKLDGILALQAVALVLLVLTFWR